MKLSAGSRAITPHELLPIQLFGQQFYTQASFRADTLEISRNGRAATPTSK